MWSGRRVCSRHNKTTRHHIALRNRRCPPSSMCRAIFFPTERQSGCEQFLTLSRGGVCCVVSRIPPSRHEGSVRPNSHPTHFHHSLFFKHLTCILHELLWLAFTHAHVRGCTIKTRSTITRIARVHLQLQFRKLQALNSQTYLPNKATCAISG